MQHVYGRWSPRMWHNGKPKKLGPLKAKSNSNIGFSSYGDPQIQNFFSAWLVQEHFYRLDPVRGCFALTASEAAELLQRYRAYGRRGKAVGVCAWGEQATAWHDGHCRLDSHGLMVMVTAYLWFVFDHEQKCQWSDNCTAKGFLRHQLNNPCDDQFEALIDHGPTLEQ